jgi:hypothetical protein
VLSSLNQQLVCLLCAQRKKSRPAQPIGIRGYGEKSVVTLEGQTPALNTKQTKKVNIVFGRMG